MSDIDKNPNVVNNPQRWTEDDEINLLEYLHVLAKRWRMILKVCAATFVISCVVALLLPNIYISTARLLPPQKESGSLSGMLGGLGDLASLAGVSVGGGGSGDLFVGMLKSRTISDVVIDTYDLMKVYGLEYRVKAYAALAKHVNIGLGKDDGIIFISVEDEDPLRAAQIANTYVAELKKLNVRFNLATAGRERLFLENRLDVVTTDLSNAEEALREFQEKNKTIKIDAQAAAIIEAIAQLKGDLAAKEVELGALQSYQTEQNPQIKTLREVIAKIKDQIRKLETSSDGQKVSGDIFLPTSDMPSLGLAYARLMRDFKVQETLFEILTRQLEMAKISEAKNVSTIQVLDEAVPADKKSKPKRSLIVLLGTFVAGFISVLWAFICEYSERMSAEDRMIWDEIRKSFKKKA